MLRRLEDGLWERLRERLWERLRQRLELMSSFGDARVARREGRGGTRRGRIRHINGDPEKINGKVVQTWYAFKPQLSFVQRWRLMGASYSQSGDFRLGELSRVAFERNDSGGGLFARLTGAFGRRGLHSQLALITGNMDQMQSGVNFVDFKAQGQDGKSAAR